MYVFITYIYNKINLSCGYIYNRPMDGMGNGPFSGDIPSVFFGGGVIILNIREIPRSFTLRSRQDCHTGMFLHGQ